MPATVDVGVAAVTCTAAAPANLVATIATAGIAATAAGAIGAVTKATAAIAAAAMKLASRWYTGIEAWQC